MADTMTNTMLKAAIWYAEMGYPVFPCVPGEKRPLTTHGLLDATTDITQIEAWWNKHPNANVAIHTEGMVVIDIDGTGDTWMGDQHDRWQDMIVAPSSATPRGGRHYLFRQPEGKNWRNTESRLAPDVDTRANGGYIVAPPSSTSNGSYSWIEGFQLDVTREQLPLPPQWLIEDLDRLTIKSTATPTNLDELTGEQITEGRRNGTLTRMAGSMRRIGMTQQEIAAALHQVNIDRCTPPVEDPEVERIAASIVRYAPDEVAQALATGKLPDQCDAISAQPRSLRELVQAHPKLRPPIVQGLLRQGETMNVIASPKIGKSWLVIDLSLSIASGRPWLNTYETIAGDVLILDNELHGETTAHRIPKVAHARNLPLNQVDDHVYVLNLRGQLKDVFSMGAFFNSLEPGRYSAIVLDAFYRFMPSNMDENDNGTMASIYNQIDAYADRLGCSFVLIHHATKGNQSGKSVTDVGAGAGSQSRATDTHLILRPHQENGAVVLDAAVRSWPPIEPLVLRWDFPVWTPAPELDPADLRRESSRRKSKTTAVETDDGQSEPPWSIGRFVQTFIAAEPRTRSQILATAAQAGLSEYKAQRLLRNAEALKHVHRWESGRNRASSYSLTPQPLLQGESQ